MTDNFATLKQVEDLRQKYTPGTRVRLTRMEYDPAPVPVGTLGTVDGVDDSGSIMVHWDNGSSLSVLFGIDRCEIVEGDR